MNRISDHLRPSFWSKPENTSKKPGYLMPKSKKKVTGTKVDYEILVGNVEVAVTKECIVRTDESIILREDSIATRIKVSLCTRTISATRMKVSLCARTVLSCVSLCTMTVLT